MSHLDNRLVLQTHIRRVYRLLNRLACQQISRPINQVDLLQDILHYFQRINRLVIHLESRLLYR